MPIFKIKHPIFCYIGTINNRIRFDWITRVAKTRPSWSFIFIGPIMQSLKVVSELKLIKNIHLMGEVKYEDLPYYFKNSDVFLIPHYRTRATIAMDPIKLYEYFLTGRPVVATDVIDDKYNNLVYTSSEYDEFVIYLEKALNENNSSITKKRISFALENTWEERTETILEILRNFQNRN
jgi:glycosyltransferase involved in cell wall biosynthesis